MRRSLQGVADSSTESEKVGARFHLFFIRNRVYLLVCLSGSNNYEGLL